MREEVTGLSSRLAKLEVPEASYGLQTSLLCIERATYFPAQARELAARVGLSSAKRSARSD